LFCLHHIVALFPPHVQPNLPFNFQRIYNFCITSIDINN